MKTNYTKLIKQYKLIKYNEKVPLNNKRIIIQAHPLDQYVLVRNSGIPPPPKIFRIILSMH